MNLSHVEPKFLIAIAVLALIVVLLCVVLAGNRGRW